MPLSMVVSDLGLNLFAMFIEVTFRGIRITYYEKMVSKIVGFDLVLITFPLHSGLVVKHLIGSI